MLNSISKQDKQESLLLDCDSVNKRLFVSNTKYNNSNIDQNEDLLFDWAETFSNDTQTSLSGDSLNQNSNYKNVSAKKKQLEGRIHLFSQESLKLSQRHKVIKTQIQHISDYLENFKDYNQLKKKQEI